jgi:hypothetical protein
MSENKNELNLKPETLKELDELAMNQRLHWKENPPTPENNAKADAMSGSKGLESLSTRLQGSSDESDRATAMVLSELSKSLRYDGHTAILANTILSKFTVPKEISEKSGKEDTVEDVTKEKEILEGLDTAKSEEMKFAIKILEILADALRKGNITELAKIVSEDYPQAFAKNPPEVLKEEAIPAGTKFS